MTFQSIPHQSTCRAQKRSSCQYLVVQRERLERRLCLRERAETAAEFFGIVGWNELLDFVVGLLPHGNSACQERTAFGGEYEDAAAAVGWVGRNLDQAAALERLEGGGERGAIHGEQGGYRAHGRWLGAIEGHQQGELAVGQVEGAQGFIEAAGEGAGGALDVKTEAAVAYEEGGFVRKQICA